MRRYGVRSIFFFFFFIWVPGVTAQINLDSLQLAVENDKYPGSLEASLKLCDYYAEVNADSMLHFALMAMTLAEQKKDPCIQLQSSQKLADAHYYTGDLAESNTQLKKGIILAQDCQQDAAFLGESYNNIGYNFQSLNELDSAMYFFNLSLVYFQEDGDSASIASVLANIGIIWFKRGRHEQALTYLLQSYQIDSLKNYEEELMSIYNDLGRVLVELNKYETGIAYYKESLNLTRKFQRNDLEAIRLNNIGMALYSMEHFDSAIVYFNRAIKIEIGIERYQALGTRYNNLGLCFEGKKEISKAAEQYKTAIHFYEAHNNTYDVAYSYINYGGILFNSGAVEEAESFLLKAREIGEKAGSLDIEEKAVSKLYSLEEIRRNYKEANSWLVRLLEIRNEKYNLEVARIAEELEEVYKTREKEAQIHQLKQDQEMKDLELIFRARQRNLAIIIALLSVVAVILLVFLWRKVAGQNQKLTRLNATLNRIFSIISHDLRGVIGAYKSAGRILKKRIQKNNYDDLPEIAEEISKNSALLSHMLDNLLNWSLAQMDRSNVNPQSFYLEELVKSELEIYLPLARAKNTELLSQIQGHHMVFADMENIRLVLRNLVNNAIKFTENGTISVSIEKEETWIALSVKDTGIGMDEAMVNRLISTDQAPTRRGTKNEQGTGLGFSLIKEYVKSNDGDIQVNPREGGGSIVKILLPEYK